MKKCNYCNGEGIIDCPDCQGIGCKHCQGQGQIECENCEGLGEKPE